MKYWNSCEDMPELGDNVIMAKKGVCGSDNSGGYRKIGSKVELVESPLGESEGIFEIEDMIYGLRCAIRNFRNNTINVIPRATCEEDVGLIKEAICWLEEDFRKEDNVKLRNTGN